MDILGEIMQSNPNIDDKRTIELWDWKDFQGDYNPWGKKYYRKVRRRRLNRRVNKKIIMTIRGE